MFLLQASRGGAGGPCTVQPQLTLRSPTPAGQPRQGRPLPLAARSPAAPAMAAALPASAARSPTSSSASTANSGARSPPAMPPPKRAERDEALGSRGARRGAPRPPLSDRRFPPSRLPVRSTVRGAAPRRHSAARPSRWLWPGPELPSRRAGPYPESSEMGRVAEREAP